MTKKKQGKARKLGAPDHFTGFKLAFLTSKASLYQQSMDSKTVSAFYDKVTRDFVAKYGLEDPFNKEPAEDPPDPEDDPGNDDPDDPANTPPSAEEADAKAELFTKLRTVSQIDKGLLPCSDCLHRNLDSGIGASTSAQRPRKRAPRRIIHFQRYSLAPLRRPRENSRLSISTSRCTTIHALKLSTFGATESPRRSITRPRRRRGRAKICRSQLHCK